MASYANYLLSKYTVLYFLQIYSYSDRYFDVLS